MGTCHVLERIERIVGRLVDRDGLPRGRRGVAANRDRTTALAASALATLSESMTAAEKER
jgi:hypothetical protein